MILNIAYPAFGTCKKFEITDEIMNKIEDIDQYHLAGKIDGGKFGPEFAGHVFRIQGGSDKEGFPMMLGVPEASRTKVLLARGSCNYQTFRGRNGERRRKSVRGMKLGTDIASLNVIIDTLGEKPIPGVTEEKVARRLGPKRANHIRKLYCLKGKDAKLEGLVKRVVTKEGKKNRYKTPKIQRLITKKVHARRAKKVREHIKKLQQSAEERKEYLRMISRRRMVLRQRKNATERRRKAAIEKADIAAWRKAGSPKVKA